MLSPNALGSERFLPRCDVIPLLNLDTLQIPHGLYYMVCMELNHYPGYSLVDVYHLTSLKIQKKKNQRCDILRLHLAPFNCPRDTLHLRARTDNRGLATPFRKPQNEPAPDAENFRLGTVS